MRRKVVYLLDQPFDPRNLQRFGVQRWIDRGWEAEVWDLAPLVHPLGWRTFVEGGRATASFAGHFLIETWAHLDERFRQSGPIDYYIDFSGERFDAVRVKLRLRRRGAKRIVCALGSLPTLGAPPAGWLGKVWAAFRLGPRVFGRRIAAAARHRIVAWRASPDVLVVSGTRSLGLVAQWPGREVIRAHNFDYDLHLRHRLDVPSTSAGVVFLDQDFCFHPDYAYDDIPVWATPEQYLPTIRRALETVGAVLTVPVRIAPHPRSDYARNAPGCFGEIPIDGTNSALLIRDCLAVTCHSSAAIQLAVLFDKPAIFVTTDELERSPAGPAIALFASEFGKAVLNLDRDLAAIDWRAELTINRDKYREYRRRYIKLDDSPERGLWDIVIDHLDTDTRTETGLTDMSDTAGNARLGGGEG
jgi:hypothetical protein